MSLPICQIPLKNENSDSTQILNACVLAPSANAEGAFPFFRNCQMFGRQSPATVRQ